MGEFNLDGEIFTFKDGDTVFEPHIFKVYNSVGKEHCLIPDFYIHSKGYVSSLSFSHSLYFGLKLLSTMYHQKIDLDFAECAGQKMLIINNQERIYEDLVAPFDSQNFYQKFLNEYGQVKFGQKSLFKYCVGLQFFSNSLDKPSFELDNTYLNRLSTFGEEFGMKRHQLDLLLGGWL